jgi:hypothetical protein
MLLPLQLHTSKFTLPLVGYAEMLRPPLVEGAYPLTAFSEAFGVHIIASVEATPAAANVIKLAHAAEEIELVPSDAGPLAMVRVTTLKSTLRVLSP